MNGFTDTRTHTQTTHTVFGLRPMIKHSAVKVIIVWKKRIEETDRDREEFQQQTMPMLKQTKEATGGVGGGGGGAEHRINSCWHPLPYSLVAHASWKKHEKEKRERLYADSLFKS